jgi:4-amino-4-deoxy-L-arabinose transferase-like glycosyltransferase
MSTSRLTRTVLAAGVAGWLGVVVLTWLAKAPLGHDETQYAIAAQDVLDGVPARWGYLSVGMNALALPGVLAGGGDLALRIMPALAGLAFLLAAAWLARRAFGDAAAAWTVAVLAATWSVARRAAELLSDLPAAACLLAGTAIVVTELVREPAPRRRLVLAAPCLAAAFYLRYGSVLAIAAIGGAALVVGGRAALRRPWTSLATIALFVLLLVPHFLSAIATTGSALGVLRMSSDVLGEAHVAQSLVTYATSNPFTYYGAVTAPVMIAGLVAIRRARDRRVLLLWLIAVADIVAVGLTPVAQPRYIFLGIVLLVILGVDELRCHLRWIDARRPAAGRALAGLATAAVAASWIVVVASVHLLDGSRVKRMTPLLAAMDAIRDDARGAPCEVIGRRTTQLQWYTGCIAAYLASPETLARVRVYLVHEPNAAHQPTLEGRPGVPRAVLERPDVTVLRYDPR